MSENSEYTENTSSSSEEAPKRGRKLRTPFRRRRTEIVEKAEKQVELASSVEADSPDSLASEDIPVKPKRTRKKAVEAVEQEVSDGVVAKKNNS